jgi:hypothetical protein
VCPTSNSYQQGEPVPIAQHSSKRCIRVWAHLVDQDTDVGWEHAAFVQQVRARTRVGSDQLFHHLPKRDGGSIERYLDTWLADDDARCTIERDSYLHDLAFLQTV